MGIVISRRALPDETARKHPTPVKYVCEILKTELVKKTHM